MPSGYRHVPSLCLLFFIHSDWDFLQVSWLLGTFLFSGGIKWLLSVAWLHALKYRLAIKSVFKCLHYWNAACILPWMDGCDQEKIYFNYHVWFHLLHLDYLPSLLEVKTNKQKRTSYMQVVCKIVLNLFIAVCFCRRSIVPN